MTTSFKLNNAKLLILKELNNTITKYNLSGNDASPGFKINDDVMKKLSIIRKYFSELGFDYRSNNDIQKELYYYNTIVVWTQLGKDIDGEAFEDFSGQSVSLSSDGTTVAIGAAGNDGDNGLNSGHVRVYKYDETTIPKWTQLGLDIEGEAFRDFSGGSVSLSSDGKTVAIGASKNDGDNLTDSGHVRVYKYDENNTPLKWTQLGLDIEGEEARDESGRSVSLSRDGKTVAIGALRNDNDNGENSGHVRVYKYDENNTPLKWTQLGMDIDGEAAFDESGLSVSLSSDGTTVAIGARSNDGDNGEDSGHVRVYKYDDTLPTPEWTPLGQEIDGKAAFDESGQSVSLSSDGTTVAIGAPQNDGDNGEDSGHVRVYKYDENNTPKWTQLGDDIYGDAAEDVSGWSVSLSSDGTTVAIGAIGNDGENGRLSGHVRVYKYDDNLSTPAWIKVGTDIDGEADLDQSGGSVSLSSDGKTVAIGASGNNGDNGLASGHVRVYKLI